MKSKPREVNQIHVHLDKCYVIFSFHISKCTGPTLSTFLTVPNYTFDSFFPARSRDVSFARIWIPRIMIQLYNSNVKLVLLHDHSQNISRGR